MCDTSRDLHQHNTTLVIQPSFLVSVKKRMCRVLRSDLEGSLGTLVEVISQELVGETAEDDDKHR